MKINLDKQFKTLSGKELDKSTTIGEIIEGHHMAKCLANCMWQSQNNSMKFKFWSEDLYKKGLIELDNTDFDVLIAWIETYGNDPQKPYNQWFAQVGIKGQVIDEMKKQKEKQEVKK